MGTAPCSLPKVSLTFSTTLALLFFFFAGTGSGAASTSVTEEFERALDLIEQTQLELFVYSAPTSTTEVLNELKRRLESSDYTELNRNARAADIKVVRKLLSETIDQYEDQYANYISPKQLIAYSERRSGSYVGVGLKFRSVTGDYPLVIGPLLGGPLGQADIKPGDRLIAIDGLDLKGYKNSTITTQLKGAPDTTFQLALGRDKKQHTVTGTRRAVDLHYARSELLTNNIGYLKISRFGGKTHKRVEFLLKEMIKTGISSVILDLRDNPGGSTRAARAIVSMFSKQPNVYCEKYKSGDSRQLPRYGDHLTNLPLAILINGESKSSTEIVAGALQGYQRALLVGSPTFGKGLVQRVFNLAEPIGGALRTTIAMFGVREHGLIQGSGLVPDYYIKTEADFMFREVGSLNISADARAYQRRLLEARIQNKYTEADREKADRLIHAKDLQLLKAVEILTDNSNESPSTQTR